MKNYCLLFLLLLFVFPYSVYAGEVKIVGPEGLTRAAKVVSKPSTVIISLQLAPEKGASIEVLLESINGLSNELEGLMLSPVLFEVRGVSEGSWRIRLKGGRASVSKVTIQ